MFDGTKCAIADYGVVPGRCDAISLTNSSQNKTAASAPAYYGTQGFATQSPNAPGDFVVAQSNPGFRPAPTEPPVYISANYVIMELGPVVDGKYDYSLITDGNTQGVFVLARDKSRFAEKYEQDVLKKLASWGFTGAGEPSVTSQENCTYPPVPHA